MTPRSWNSAPPGLRQTATTPTAPPWTSWTAAPVSSSTRLPTTPTRDCSCSSCAAPIPSGLRSRSAPPSVDRSPAMNTVRHRILAPSIAFALLVAATAAWADTPIDETRALDPDGRIEIDNLKGRIDVEAWDRAEVRITGSLGEGVEKLEIDGDNRSLSVRVKYPRRGGLGFRSGDNTGPTRLHVMVPLRADLEIDSVAADIDVVGVAPAEVSIDSVSGKVVLVGAPRELSVETVSGDLRVTSNSRDVDIASVSGDI